MIQAARRLGFAAKGVKCKMENLRKIPLPAIGHLIIKDTLHHFVVLTEVSERYLKIMDPADGRVHRVSYTAFEKIWTGVLVLLLPDEGFKRGNEKMGTWWRLWLLLQPHWGVLLQVLFGALRSVEHTSELKSLMRISYAVFCWKKKKKYITQK